MRTEDDLREALASPMDAERADRLARTITAATAAPARRRGPVLVLGATVLVLAVIAGFILDNRTREAAPVETPTPTLAGEARTEGNWRMVHRVDVPPEWQVTARDVTAEVERTELMGLDGAASCSVGVWQAGTRPTSVGSGAPPQPEPLDDITINGRPAYRLDDKTLQWFYRDDAVARATCDGLWLSRMIAERVVFEPAIVRVPLRLRQVPEGYQLHRVTEEGDDSAPASVLSLTPIDADQAWEIEILVNKKVSDPTRRERTPSAGVERDTIAGFPAVLDPKTGSLDLDVDPYLIKMHFAYGQDSDRWAPGRRQQLVRLAESMELAPDLGDRATWFDAEEAVPN
jgi:hypothetical protein